MSPCAVEIHQLPSHTQWADFVATVHGHFMKNKVLPDQMRLFKKVSLDPAADIELD